MRWSGFWSWLISNNIVLYIQAWEMLFAWKVLVSHHMKVHPLLAVSRKRKWKTEVFGGGWWLSTVKTLALRIVELLTVQIHKSEQAINKGLKTVSLLTILYWMYFWPTLLLNHLIWFHCTSKYCHRSMQLSTIRGLYWMTRRFYQSLLLLRIFAKLFLKYLYIDGTRTEASRDEVFIVYSKFLRVI